MPAMPLDLFFLATIAATTPEPAPRPVVSAMAQVTVRIVTGARVEMGKSASASGHAVRQGTVTVEDGSKRPARLVEFE